MYLCYFDETGDDGFPNQSSNFFVLTSLYMHHLNWKANYNHVLDFRRQLKSDYNLPIKFEFHTKPFLTDKNPYRDLKLTKQGKKEILFLFFELLASLDLKIINVVINKDNIDALEYNVLDRALTYNIQRIENDLKSTDPAHRFLLITDEGRLSKMVKTTRKIQKINFIPSKYNNGSYRNEIEKMIEDPLPKKSSESFFIQLADMVSYVVFLYCNRRYSKINRWANRVMEILDYGDEIKLLDRIISVLNTKASSDDKFGVVVYPKPR